MSVNAIRAIGTTFSRDNGATFDVIPGVENISGGGTTTTPIPAGGLNPPDGYQTFLAGMKTAEPVTVTFEMTGDQLADGLVGIGLIRSDCENGYDVQKYRLDLTDGATVVFEDSVAQSFTIGEMTPEGKYTATFVFQPGKKPDYLAAP